MAASAETIEEFLNGPLICWLATCVKKPQSLQIFDNFFDGAPIIEVLLQIDPEPAIPIPSTTNLQGISITCARTKMFHSIIRNIKTIYEEELGQIVIALPDCVTLGRAPGSEMALEQLKVLILLLLGCAVQGPTKETFITKIKALPLDTQHSIVECIKKVTDDQTVVLTFDWNEQTAQRLYTHVKSLITDRDYLIMQWINDMGQESTGSSSGSLRAPVEGVESNHFAVELADWKAKLRKQRQELEEKTEILAECREELQHVNSLVIKLKSDNGDLLTEARKAKLYRDEVDALRERSERADKLELEAQRYRERLADAEFYKLRVDELREDNRVLVETREMLESQLSRARQRADHVLDLESELLTQKQNLNDVLVERDSLREKLQELVDENIQLQHIAKTVLQENSICPTQNVEDEVLNSGDTSLSEQLTNSAQTRALKLELENKKLLSTIEAMKERYIHESANKILEMEREKKMTTMKCEQLQENINRLNQQNNELESLFKNAIHENRKLQDSLNTSKMTLDRQMQDFQNDHCKIIELERVIDVLTNEKEHIQMLCESVKSRADSAEKSLAQASSELNNIQAQNDKISSLQYDLEKSTIKSSGLEKDVVSFQKDITKYKEIIEEKSVLLDKESQKNDQCVKDIQKCNKENENLVLQLEQLQEYKQSVKELISEASVQSETIAMLQKDLISEKLSNEKIRTSLERIGLSVDLIDKDFNEILEEILKVPDAKKNLSLVISKHYNPQLMCSKCQTDNVNDTNDTSDNTELNQRNEKLHNEINNLQHTNVVLQEENAKMQVDIATYKSQIQSLQSQQTALQLANSQLISEKDSLSQERQIQNNHHDTLLLDQLTLRTLHEQLNTEYEDLKREQEILRKSNRELRSEVRTVKESNVSLVEKMTSLDTERDQFMNDAKNLGVLRAEHSKLKDDFRNLFTASERLKTEYRNVQDELKNLRSESRTLRLGQTEMQGELNSRSDLVAGLQLENAKLQQKCDMLFEMNHSLDSDRRALMDHVSQLLSQYHSLLTHSLEDKQHYHHEEKLYADKVNNLCRQKEKLEEKIMEHYRKLDNASSKKRGFGATLVRRVRKAGSDIINRVPSRNRRSWHDDISNRPLNTQINTASGSGDSGENESDNSIDDNAFKSESQLFKRSSICTLHGSNPKDEIALRRSHRDNISRRSSFTNRNSLSCENHSTFVRDNGTTGLGLGSVGSRRTVYLSEEDNSAVAHPAVSTPPSTPPPNSSSSNTKEPQPLLVYNKISTVIGDTHRVVTQSKSNDDNVKDNNTEKKKNDHAKETAVWYEYGCV